MSRRRRLRRRGAILVGTALLLAVPVALGWFPQGFLRRGVEGALQSALGPEARLGGLHVVPILLSAEVEELHLAGPGWALDLPRGHVALSPGAVFGGPPTLRALELQSPRLSLTPAPAPAESAITTGPEPATFPLRVDRFQIADGSVVWEGAERSLGIAGLEAAGSLGTGAVDLSAPRVDLFGDPSRSAALTARLSLSPDLSLELERLELGYAGTRLELGGSVGPLQAPRPRLDARLSLELSSLAAALQMPPASGNADARFEVASDGTLTRVEGDVSGSDLEIAGWPIDRVEASLSGSADDGEARIRVDALGGNLVAQARLAGGRLDGRLELSDVDSQRLSRARGDTPLPPGRLRGELRFAGPVPGDLEVSGRVGFRSGRGALDVSGELAGRADPAAPGLDLRWSASAGAQPPVPGLELGPLRRAQLRGSGRARGAAPPDVDLDAEVEGSLDVETAEQVVPIHVAGVLGRSGARNTADLRLEVAGAPLRLEVEQAGAGPMQLRLAGSRLELQPVDPRLQGDVAFEVRATRDGDSLAGSGRVEVGDLSWDDVALGDAGVELSADGERATAVATLAALGLEVEAGLPLPAADPTDLAVRLSDTPLELLSRLAGGPEVSGFLSGEGRARVERERPLEARAELRLDELALTRGALDVRLEGPLALRWEEQRLRIDGLDASGSGFRLSGSGELGIEPDSEVAASFELAAELERLPLPEGWTAVGRLDAVADLAGTSRRPQLRGTASLQDVRMTGVDLPELRLPAARLELEGDAVRLPETTAEVLGGSISLEGRLPVAALLPEWRADPGAVSPTESADLRLRWSGLDAAALIGIARGTPVEGVDVALAGEARVAGGLTSLEELTLKLDLEGASLELEGQPLRLDPLALTLEAGRLRLEPVGLVARNARFELTGEADLAREQVQLTARGELPLRALNPFLDGAALTGTGSVEIGARGDWSDPALTGRVSISDATLRLRALEQGLSDIEADLVFEGDRLRVESGRARFGGGPVTLAGNALVDQLALGELRLEMTGRGVALRYPEGLNSRLDADLVLAGQPGDLRLTGTVTATRGLYDLDIALGSSMLAAPVVVEPSPMLQAIALQIDVIADQPVLVRNNLARLEARGRLTARGDMDRPEPYGRLEILNGGKVFLRNHEFAIESGSMVYGGDWNPSVSLVAKTEITDSEQGSRDYEVTVRASGPMESLQITFSSDPAESEAAVLSLIATGTTQGGRGLSSGASVAGEQLAAFLTGRLTGELSRSLQQLGFDEVSIQPQLLAREEDPTARFTFGKQVLPGLKLIYSIGLGGAEERFARLELAPWRNFTAAVQRRDDGLTSFSVGQRLRFGEAGRVQRAPERERTRLRAVELEGAEGLDEARLRGAPRAEAGRRVTEWELQEDAERLRVRLVDEGYLEAQVGARLEEGTARFAIRPGPRYSWKVSGMSDPPDLGATIREAFHEEEALERGRARLLEALRKRGHLRAEVDAEAEPADGERRLLFEVRPGPLLRIESLEFSGAEGLSQGRLLDAAGGVASLLVEPDAARERIVAAYREAHYLGASALSPIVEQSGDGLRIRVQVDEGPRARLASARVVGAPEQDPAPDLGIGSGEAFSERATLEAEQRLREHYLARGYPAVRVRTRMAPDGNDLAAVFELTTGEAVRIGKISVSGLDRTRETVVRGRLRFDVGDPLDPRDLVAAESRLLALGIFDRVAVFAEGNPAEVKIEVDELPRVTAGYDLRYNDEESLSALLEGELGNVAGSGLNLGLRGRVGRDVREVRGSVFRPALILGGDLTLSVFQLEEDLDSGLEDSPDNLRRERGIELQQNLLLPDRWNLLYGYRFRRSTLVFADTGLSFPQNVAALTLGAFRDSRDNVLDPRRGRFLSANLTLAPKWLGSTLPFVKGFAQASFVRRVGPSLLWAHGYRVGLGSGLDGQPMPSFERFRAGGPNSLRGFATNEVGPRDFLGEPSGGEAVLILNQELRWRHAPTGLGAAVFYDAGEVFETLSDIDLDWRHVVGVGVRYESPIGLLRFDWGFPLDPREGERSNRIHFSLGQAF